MAHRYYIGVDPGSSGGLACIDQDDKVFALQAMPRELSGIWEWFEKFVGFNAVAVLEQVSGYIGKAKNKDGSDGNTGSSMFTFGQSFGALRMALVASGFTLGSGEEKSYSLILPQRWQRGLGLKTKAQVEEYGGNWKGYLRNEAKKRFPRIKPTLKTGDALLIAKYCQLLYGRF